MSLRKLFGPTLHAQRAYLFAIHANGFKKHVSATLLELHRRKQDIEFGKQPAPPAPRSSYLEWNLDAELFSFTKRIKENIDPNLLLQAITSREFIIQEEERQKSVGITDPIINVTDNIALVKEGNEFLSQYIKQYLRIVLPFFPEEGIRSVHDYLVSDDVLAHIATHIGMADFIQTAEYPAENSSLSSSFKALIEAIRQSNDDTQAGNFVRDFVIVQLAGKNVNDIWNIENPIDKLNQIYHNHNEELPEPRLIGSAGKNTIMACYRIGLYNKDKQLIGEGPGESIEIAHEIAAINALRRLFRTSDRDIPIRYDVVIDFKNKKTINPSIEEWNEPKIALEARG